MYYIVRFWTFFDLIYLTFGNKQSNAANMHLSFLHYNVEMTAELMRPAWMSCIPVFSASREKQSLVLMVIFMNVTTHETCSSIQLRRRAFYCLCFGVHFSVSEGNSVALIPLSLRCSAARRGIFPTTPEKLQRATQKHSERSLSNSNSWAGMRAPCVASVHKPLMGLRL